MTSRSQETVCVGLKMIFVWQPESLTTAQSAQQGTM
jgi:hypothetical protein